MLRVRTKDLIPCEQSRQSGSLLTKLGDLAKIAVNERAVDCVKELLSNAGVTQF